MPRANRYIVAGRIYHITHRCHDRALLLKFAQDREAYRSMLREHLQDARTLSLLTYCITSNHTHLLLTTRDAPEAISRFMQLLEGEFAKYYNRRKKRTGAFWEDRYHATMIDGGEYLWNCLKYIDLNMVRAGVVGHPSEWEWTGYQELSGRRKRYRMLDVERLYEGLGGRQEAEFRTNYDAALTAARGNQELSRDEKWTESLAVGRQNFVEEVGRGIRNRMNVEVEQSGSGWVLRESKEAYSRFSGQKIGSKGSFSAVSSV